MYYKIDAKGGPDPDLSCTVVEQAVMIQQLTSTIASYLKRVDVAYVEVRQVTEHEFLQWVQDHTSYGGRKYGRRGQGEIDG